MGESHGLSEAALVGELAAVREEVGQPGYWATLHENTHRWAEELSVGPFWTDVKNNLNRWRTEYSARTGSALVEGPFPHFVAKSEAGVKDKLLRAFRADADFVTRSFPLTGPPIPLLTDLVRTRIACPYIDGVEFLATAIQELAESKGWTHTRQREGKIEGYFAQHLGVEQEVIYRVAGSSTLARVVCEIQVASVLATRMWDATHPLYEEARGRADNPEHWQWKPDDPRFIANQAGHMIHLADGLLIQLRDGIRNRKGPK